jgi:dynactin complex subunit
MRNKAIFSKLGELEFKINSLTRRIWKLENLPKFKNGDVVIIYDSVKSEVEVIGKPRLSFSFGKFKWIYLVRFQNGDCNEFYENDFTLKQ